MESFIVELGNYLKENGYEFITITPNSHQRILIRKQKLDQNTEISKLEGLRNFFGWNVELDRNQIKSLLTSSLYEKGEELEIYSKGEKENGLKSKIRFSTFEGQFFAHTSFPTVEDNSIFFGPDTYRYFNFLREIMEKFVGKEEKEEMKIVDIGVGSGAGALFLSKLANHHKGMKKVYLTDINPKAITFSSANSKINFPKEKENNLSFHFLISDVLKQVEEEMDLIVSNPPYMIDLSDSSSKSCASEGKSRIYRNGGGSLGLDLSERIIREGAARLRRGGRIGVYTGVPILEGGIDLFKNQVIEMTKELGLELQLYREMDPDVWGEELETQVYSKVERIAVVSLLLRKI